MEREKVQEFILLILKYTAWAMVVLTVYLITRQSYGNFVGSIIGTSVWLFIYCLDLKKKEEKR
ncbi:MAG: hypothetical protein LBM95_09715 [Lactobacillales bacterium]|nr:hypothetical protein [Lactobacillales bacterium]